MIISKLEKEQKLKKILDFVKKESISAYVISQKTGLSEAGVGRILNGKIKNPNANTVVSIYEYLFSSNTVAEPLPTLCKDGICFNDIEIAVHVATNESDFMKIKIFENIIERNVANRILDILKDGKLKEFLT